VSRKSGATAVVEQGLITAESGIAAKRLWFGRAPARAIVNLGACPGSRTLLVGMRKQLCAHRRDDRTNRLQAHSHSHNAVDLCDSLRAERDATGHGEMLVATWMQEQADAGPVC
jgi:hypothetical protein